MDHKQIQDVIVTLGGLSGYAALTWTIYRDLAVKREREEARLQIIPMGRREGVLHFRVEFDPSDATEALVADVEIIGSPDARLTEDISLLTIHDPMTDTAKPNPDFVGSRALKVQLHRHYDFPDKLGAQLAAVGSSSGISLKVTVSTWPTAKRLMRKNRYVSAHA